MPAHPQDATGGCFQVGILGVALLLGDPRAICRMLLEDGSRSAFAGGGQAFRMLPSRMWLGSAVGSMVAEALGETGHGPWP